ncbi:MAG: ketosteroid isomerase-like protein [Gammaproteobacteria bacterium]|jgi:ketosteroid isomerase-like protein
MENDLMPNEAESRATNKSIIAEFFKALSSGDVVRIGKFLSDDCSWWVSGTVAGISGTYNKTETLALLEQVTQVYKSGALKIDPSNMIAEGKRVAVEAESYAELHNGKVYNNLYHYVFDLESGKIKSFKEYMDTQHVQDTFVE